MSSVPKTIKEFGYGFNEEGQLRQLDKSGVLTDLPFQFNFSDKHSENQRHYEELGEAVTEHIFGLLESQAGLQRLPVPVDAAEPRSFIFASDDALSNPDKLIVLVHGSGVVRAGQWARSLIINDRIETGTQLSYIAKAKALGYGVLVVNTNDNQRIVNGRRLLIPCSSTPEEHADSVWASYIRAARAGFVAVVAHSYGGVVTVGLAQKLADEFKNRVKAVAMTDSVHSFQREGISSDVEAYLRSIGKNWVSSHDPLETPQKSPDYEIPRISAGTPKHEMTSHCAIDSVFDFLEEKYSGQLP